jgi:hypothetical protein
MTKNFDEEKRVPIHITLDRMEKRPVLSDYKGSTTLKDADTYLLSGTIDNFDRDLSADGKTYPSLEAMGDKNPFFGSSDGKIELYRLGNMHGQANDGHWVFTYPSGSQNLTMNGMSYTLTAFTAPTMLFGSDVAVDALQSVEIRPHIPFAANGHSVVMAPVSVGAELGKCDE